MIEFLKIIHFLAMAVGIGGGVANGVIGARMPKTDPAGRPALGAVSATLGMLSAAALALLWITGIALVYLVQNGWSALPTAFWVKIAFVVALTLLSIRLNMIGAAARKSGTPPPAKTMARLGQVASVCSLLIVVCAALAFTA